MVGTENEHGRRRFLGSLDQLSTSVESLHDSVGPLSPIARRLPGQSRVD